jgi:hypothetical protein
VLTTCASAAVVSVGSVAPIPPTNGGTFPTPSELTVGEGTDDTENDIWGYVSLNGGTLLQYGSLIIGEQDGYFGQVNVDGNFLAGQITQFNFTAQGSSSSPTVQVGREGTAWLNVGGGSWMTLTNTNGDMSIGTLAGERR